MKKQKNCYGCKNSFESYEMTQEQGVNHNGHTYCNDDCVMSTEVDESENAMYMNECGLNSDGSEWY